MTQINYYNIKINVILANFQVFIMFSDLLVPMGICAFSFNEK